MRSMLTPVLRQAPSWVLSPLLLISGMVIGMSLCAPAAAAASADATTIPVSAPALAGIVLEDQAGGRHDLATEAPGHPLLLFTVAHRTAARRWDEVLTPYLGSAHSLLRVIDASAIAPEDRPTLRARLIATVAGSGLHFLLDWSGAVRPQVGAPDPEQVALIGISPTGGVLGPVIGPVNVPRATEVLAWFAIVPVPPLAILAPRPQGHSP